MIAFPLADSIVVRIKELQKMMFLLARQKEAVRSTSYNFEVESEVSKLKLKANHKTDHEKDLVFELKAEGDNWFISNGPVLLLEEFLMEAITGLYGVGKIPKRNTSDTLSTALAQFHHTLLQKPGERLTVEKRGVTYAVQGWNHGLCLFIKTINMGSAKTQKAIFMFRIYSESQWQTNLHEEDLEQTEMVLDFLHSQI